MLPFFQQQSLWGELGKEGVAQPSSRSVTLPVPSPKGIPVAGRNSKSRRKRRKTAAQPVTQRQSIGAASRLTGQHVALLPLTRRDYDFVYNLEVAGPLATRYRFRAVTPSPEQFPEMLWAGVLTQHVMAWKNTGKRIGTVMCFGADFRNRHAHIGGALVRDAPSPYALEGFALFLDHLFAEFDFRKVYGDALEPNVRAFSSAIGSILHEEGRLRLHDYYDGAYRDLVTLAIYREEWEALRATSNGQRKIEVGERLSALSRATSKSLTSSPLADRLRRVMRADTSDTAVGGGAPR